MFLKVAIRKDLVKVNVTKKTERLLNVISIEFFTFKNAKLEKHTASNTVISPNFMVWKLCLPQNFHTMKLGEMTVFYAVACRIQI